VEPGSFFATGALSGGPTKAYSDAMLRRTFRLLLGDDLKVGRAWALKERFRHFWEYTYRLSTETFFARWFWRATH